MYDDNMKTTVRVDTASDTTAIDKLSSKVVDLKAVIDKINGKSFSNLTKNLDGLAAKVKAAAGVGDLDKNVLGSMQALRQRFVVESKFQKQRAREEADAAKARKLFDSEDLARLRERLTFSSRMFNQQRREAADLARLQMQGARDVARAAREAASVQSAAIKGQIAQFRELERARAQAMRSAATGSGRVRNGVTRAAVVGAAGTAVVGAGARRGLDRLTGAGVSIDDAVTAASIHIYGSLSAKQARSSADALRKRLMPEAVKLGTRTADLLSAYVEASQAGVDNDILDKVVGLGSRYAKMNKLSLPNTLEETGYALQGLKSFGTVNDKIVSQYFNGMSYLVATTAANREQMSAFGKRGLSAGASVGMSMQDTLAFGAAATAAGAEGSQASRMLSSQGGRIAGWDLKARDISRKHHKTEEDRLFMQAPQMMGFGNYQNLAAKFKTDFFSTFAEVQDGLKRIVDPLKRRSLEKMLFGQEFGALTDSMIMGGNLREYRKKLNSPEAGNFIDKNWDKQTGSLGFIIDQIRATFQNLKDSLGLALKPFYSDLRDWVLKLPITFQNIEDSFKVGLRGLMSGLGSKDGTVSGLLKEWLGDPAQFKLNTAWINDFSRGFGQGLREVGETVRKFMMAFTGGDGSPEAMGRMTARILGFSAALVVAAPAITILGGLGSAIAAFATVVSASAGVLRAAGLMGGTAGAVAKRAGVAGSTGILGRILGTMGRLVPAIAAPLTMDPSKADADRMTGKLGRWAQEQERMKGGVRGWVDPPASRAIRESQERLRGAIEENTLIQKQSLDGGGDLKGLIHRTSLGDGDVREAIDRMGARVQLAALGGLNSGSIARAAGTGSVGSAMGAAGIPYSPGGGGAGLSSNAPGKAFSIPGVGKRYGVGGAGAPNENFTGSNADVLKQAAASLGTSPKDLATVISYETAGKFSPSIKGGKGGNYQGLIQFGPAERAKYGVTGNETFAGQMPKVVAFLKDRGFKPGMGLMDLYSTINAGSPGHYNASDGNGTVASHVAKMQAQHGARADAFLRSGTSDVAAAGSSGSAVDIAGKFLGKNEWRDRGELSKFVGHDVAGDVNAWCARFVNASLRDAGVKGTGSAVANSFLRWGKAVDAEAAAKGDVLVEHRGRGAGQGGGHVGLATGRKEWRHGRLFLESISGNHGDSVVKDWTAASKLAVRRAEEALGGKPGTFSGGQDIGDGIKGSGWHKADAGDLAKQSPAERLASQAPPRPQAGGGGGGSGASVVPTIHIHESGNPEHTANQVQRRIQDTKNYLTHDLSFESI